MLFLILQPHIWLLHSILTLHSRRLTSLAPFFTGFSLASKPVLTMSWPQMRPSLPTTSAPPLLQAVLPIATHSFCSNSQRNLITSSTLRLEVNLWAIGLACVTIWISGRGRPSLESLLLSIISWAIRYPVCEVRKSILIVEYDLTSNELVLIVVGVEVPLLWSYMM